MKTTEILAQPMLRAIQARQKANAEPLVVAIEAYPGTGKSSLASYLETEHGMRVLRQDDYLLSLDQRLALLENSPDPLWTVVHEFHDDDRLKRDVMKFGQTSVPGDVLLVEGVFLFDLERYSDMWDLAVYLKDDLDRTDARRVRREKAKWGDEYLPETHPKSLFALVIKAYRRWIDETNPEKRADLVLIQDG